MALEALLVPPAINTLPLLNRVAVCKLRPLAIEPAEDQELLTGSYNSALARNMPPPATRTSTSAMTLTVSEGRSIEDVCPVPTFWLLNLVDTHVRRLSQRLGLTREEDPVKIERDLIKLVPREDWGRFPHLLIWHGRRVCLARMPRCEECVLNDLCPSSRV